MGNIKQLIIRPSKCFPVDEHVDTALSSSLE